jgi:hypothetical protein
VAGGVQQCGHRRTDGTRANDSDLFCYVDQVSVSRSPLN